MSEKTDFLNLLDKAIKPVHSTSGRKPATRKPSGYTGKRTRSRKSAGASSK